MPLFHRALCPRRTSHPLSSLFYPAKQLPCENKGKAKREGVVGVQTPPECFVESREGPQHVHGFQGKALPNAQRAVNVIGPKQYGSQGSGASTPTSAGTKPPSRYMRCHMRNNNSTTRLTDIASAPSTDFFFRFSIFFTTVLAGTRSGSKARIGPPPQKPIQLQTNARAPGTAPAEVHSCACIPTIC